MSELTIKLTDIPASHPLSRIAQGVDYLARNGTTYVPSISYEALISVLIDELEAQMKLRQEANRKLAQAMTDAGIVLKDDQP